VQRETSDFIAHDLVNIPDLNPVEYKIWNIMQQRVYETRVNIQQAVRVATQYASAPCKLTVSSHLFATWHLFRHVGYLRHQQQVDL